MLIKFLYKISFCWGLMTSLKTFCRVSNEYFADFIWKNHCRIFLSDICWKCARQTWFFHLKTFCKLGSEKCWRDLCLHICNWVFIRLHVYTFMGNWKYSSEIKKRKEEVYVFVIEQTRRIPFGYFSGVGIHYQARIDFVCIVSIILDTDQCVNASRWMKVV